jgi:ABC-2 type transport system ATP-binding protein
MSAVGRKDAVIEVRGLTKRYGPTLAVDDLTFDVQPGRVTGFLGPNGAGKSTTMRLILGLDVPNMGTATVAGRPYRTFRRPLFDVGATLESGSVHPGRTARRHLQSLAAANGIGSARVDVVLDMVGLTSVSGRRAGGFSLGMHQRLGVAAALLGDPAVLVLDEPANGLDPEGIVWMRSLLRSLASEGRTVFVSSHLMAEMALTADHLIVIGRGRLLADTTVASFVQRNAPGPVRVRSPMAARLADVLTATGAEVTHEADGAFTVRGADAATIGELAFTHSVPIHELSPQSASLEQAFIELAGGSADYQAHTPQGDETGNP